MTIGHAFIVPERLHAQMMKAHAGCDQQQQANDNKRDGLFVDSA
jgi:hypothetical protein